MKKFLSYILVIIISISVSSSVIANTWTQTDWSGSDDEGTYNNPSQENWNKYSTKSSGVSALDSVTMAESSTTFTENFSTTTYKDAENTTANWDTANGELKLSRGSASAEISSVGHGPTKFSIDGSYMLDSDTIFVEGENQGKIYKTDDTGATWTEVYSTSNQFVQIFFLNGTTGWALAECGNIHQTTDGGNNWSQVGTVNNCGSSANEISFIDADTGWFAGGNGWNPDSPGLISKTTDGGENWVNQTIPDSAGEVEGIHFINSTTGWAVGVDKDTGQTKILYTGDGGTNWAVQTPPEGFTEPLASVYFADANTGWAIGSTGGLINTVNGGTTWTSISDLGGNPTKIQFADASNGWISTNNSNVLKTTNGGTSWTTIQVDSINDLGLYNVHFISTTVGIASGDNGNIYKTSDGGVAWTSISTGPRGSLQDSFFINANTGYTAGTGGLIFKTANGGSTWTAQNSGIVNTLNSIYFYDSNNGWIAGSTGLILKTTNGGTNWSAATTDINDNLNGIYFINSTTGWAVGENGRIIKTTNGGDGWSTQTTGITQTINDIQCLSATDCYAVANSGNGNDSMLLTTTNGGTTWTATEITDGWEQTLNSVFFLNSSLGWVASASDGIKYTTNGGSTWSTSLTGESTIYDIYFTDASTGWMVKSSSILQSNNGGSTWNSIRDEWGADLRGINFSSATSGYAVGDKGNVFNLSVTLGDYNTPLNAISTTIDNTAQNIIKATLTATSTLNGQTITYYLSRDGGVSYEEVSSGVEHTFTSAENEKSALKWKAILAGTTSATPIIDSLTITYKYYDNSSDQLTTSESFNDTTKKDSVNTTGNWETSSGEAKLNVSTYAAAGTDLHRTPTSRHLYGTYFLSDNVTGWTVGEKGQILKTTNGGTSWVQINNFENYNRETLYDIFFLDANNGWIVGASTPLSPGVPNAVIYKTTNGGTSWSRNVVTGGNSMRTGFFLDANVGFMAGSMTLNKTTDGGTNWTAKTSNLVGDIYGIHAIEGDTDVAAAVSDSGSISISSDNGETWNAQAVGEGINYYDVYVINATTILMVGGTSSACKVYKGTNDGSWTFNEINLDGITCNNKLTSLHYIGGSNFVAAGLGNNIIKSTDNGDTWTAISIGSPTTGESSLNFRDIFFAAIDGNGWIIGDNGSIWKTENGGTNWTLLSGSFGGQITDMMFTDANTGWAVISGDGINGATITTNAGSTWTDKTSNDVMTGPTNGIYALNSSTAWITHNNATLKTTNGGTAWSSTASPVSGLQKIYFVNSSTGWAVGDSGVIIKTTDGGASWSQQGEGVTTYNLKNLHFVSTSVGWIIGNQAPPDTGKIILYTANGGSSWTEQQGSITGFSSMAQLQSLYFQDSNTGWVLSSDTSSGTRLLKTTNGGTSWSTIDPNLGTSNSYSSIYFANSQVGFLAGTNGSLAKTTNGGTTWSTISTTVNGDFQKIHCPTSTICFAGGQGGSTVKLTISPATYDANAIIQSTTMDTTSDTIISALLTVVATLGENITYYLSANGGTNWEQVTSGESHSFTNTASDLRWKANINSANSNTETPTISSVSINYNYYPPSQSITSSWFNSQDSTSMWNSISWTESIPTNTDIKIQLRTAPDNEGVPGTPTDFCGPDNSNSNTCNPYTYFTNPAGSETIDNIMNDGQNDQWIQYKVFLTTNGVNIPSISSITFDYDVNTAPTAPTTGFTAPTNTYTPTIQWNAGTDTQDAAAALHYVIRIGTNADPTTTYTIQGTTEDNITSYAVSTALENNTIYYYTVKTVDSGDLSSSWSTVQTFTTNVNTAPTAPTTGFTAPTNTYTPTIQWNAGTDTQDAAAALHYVIRIGTNADPTTTYTIQGTTEDNTTSYTVTTSLINATTYYYAIKTVDSGDLSSSWSVVQTFTPSITSVVIETVPIAGGGGGGWSSSSSSNSGTSVSGENEPTTETDDNEDVHSQSGEIETKEENLKNVSESNESETKDYQKTSETKPESEITEIPPLEEELTTDEDPTQNPQTTTPTDQNIVTTPQIDNQQNQNIINNETPENIDRDSEEIENYTLAQIEENDLEKATALKREIKIPDNENPIGGNNNQNSNPNFQFTQIYNNTQDENQNGIGDHWEKALFNETKNIGKNTDIDKDGVNDQQEFKLKLNPFSKDTDEDGISDADEIKLGLDPKNPDTDRDGIPDKIELQLKTNPLDKNSKPIDNDNNQISDEWEEKNQIKVQSGWQDTDGDGISDKMEYLYGTDPKKADTDNDGYSDGEEIMEFKTDPLIAEKIIEKDIKLNITNWKWEDKTVDNTPVFVGIGPKNTEFNLYIQKTNGESKLIGTGKIQANNKFIIETVNKIENGDYLFYLENKQNNKIASNKILLKINNELEIKKPEILNLENKAKNNTEKGKITLAGKAEKGTQVIINWHSLVYTSTLFVDAISGDFEATPPKELETGEHEVYVYTYNPAEQIKSEKIKMKFNILQDGAILLDNKNNINQITVMIILLITISSFSAIYIYKYKK